MSFYPPIAISVYSRKEHLKKCLEALMRNPEFSKHPLYIFSDGAADESVRPEIDAVRQFAQSWVALHGGEVVEREENLRFHNIVRGIDYCCEKYGSVIFIEDDVIVSPDYLRYMNRCMSAYQDEPSVFGVSGFMYPDTMPPEPTTFFLNFGFLWGFGIWKRTWDLYEFNPSGFEEFLTNQENRYRFNFDNNYSYSNMLQKVKTVGEETNWDIRKSFTWDIQLSYQVFKHKGLFLHPCQSLVRNVGVGVGANYQQAVSSPFSGHDPLIHGNETMDDYLYPRLNTFSLPSTLAPNEQAYQCLCQMFSRFRLKSRQRKTLLQKIRNLPKKVGKFLLSTLKGAPTA